MNELTSRERIQRILDLEPVDRVGLFESFWDDTQKAWIEEGHLQEGEDLAGHFGLDIRLAGGPNLMPVLDYEDEILEETNEWKLVRNANGAHLKWWKHKAGTPEHVDFEVKDRQGWEEMIRPGLLDESLVPRRSPVETYKAARQMCQDNDLFLCWGGLNVFELMHPACGHENMLMGMALDPDWVKDMCEVYSDLIIKVQEDLFSRTGTPDAIWFFEDMGFKNKPFMSPAMYKDIVWPAHKKTFDYAHSIGCKVIIHSCGFVDAFVPGLIEAGMDCLQAMEVKAGMDLVDLKTRFGDTIAFCGGMDIRTLESNDTAQVEAELQAKLPAAMKDSGYILHTDHSVSSRVDYATYRYFVDRGLELGTYK
ncbi:MAG: hypothetical protein GVY16_11520 [Planctomycetes bacterium]|jgi:uroporphyrinogen decarboxylase|nr:hypothetical protein [Planctomycetota bacterium]